jgi:hypothetical protein
MLWFVNTKNSKPYEGSLHSDRKHPPHLLHGCIYTSDGRYMSWAVSTQKTVYIQIEFIPHDYDDLDFNRSRRLWPFAATSEGLQARYILVMIVKAMKT